MKTGRGVCSSSSRVPVNPPSVLLSPESGILGISCPRQTLLHPTLC